MRWKELRRKYSDRLSELATMPPHQVLGVSVDANSAEIRASYIELVKAYHPDRADPFLVRHNEEMLKLINAAYKQLSKV